MADQAPATAATSELSEEARRLKKAAEVERKKAEIRARVAEARKQQDLEIARKQMEDLQLAQAAAASAAAANPAAVAVNESHKDGATTAAAAAPAGGSSSSSSADPAAAAVAAAAAGGGGGDEHDGVLRIDAGYAHFKILPQDDERGNPNFPYNLHNACELFCRTGNVGSAVKARPHAPPSLHGVFQ